MSFCFLQIFQKTNEKIRLTELWHFKSNCFHSLFGRIEGHFEINWPLVSKACSALRNMAQRNEIIYKGAFFFFVFSGQDGKVHLIWELRLQKCDEILQFSWEIFTFSLVSIYQNKMKKISKVVTWPLNYSRVDFAHKIIKTTKKQKNTGLWGCP